MLVGKKRQMVCPAAPHVTMVRAIRQTDASYTQTMKIPCAGHAPAMHEMINEFPRLVRAREHTRARARGRRRTRVGAMIPR